MRPILSIFSFLVGICLGSFANVCIYRLPKGKSIVWPGSFCPRCKKGILWYDNIPLLSFLLLRGKCRFCREKISSRYFIVELLTGVLTLLLFLKFNISLEFLIYLIFIGRKSGPRAGTLVDAISKNKVLMFMKKALKCFTDKIDS